MDAPAEICDTCGKTITDEDLESGSAISVLGKSYCPSCKGEAFKTISLEDLAVHRPAKGASKPPTKPSPSPPVPKAAAPPAKAPGPGAPVPGPAKKVTGGIEVVKLDFQKVPSEIEVSRGSRPPPDPTPRTMLAPHRGRSRPDTRRATTPSSKKALLVALGAVLVVVAAVIIAFPKDAADKKGKPISGGSATNPISTPPGESREAKAERAFKKVLDLSLSIASADEILAACAKAQAECKGTSSEAKLEEIRQKALADKKKIEADRALQPLLDQLLKDVAADTTFGRYSEIEEKFRQAKELAAVSGSAKGGEITELARAYTKRYELKAEPYGREIEEAAQTLMNEKRYDAALERIESFPRELRYSGAWRSLERLKREIESLKKNK